MKKESSFLPITIFSIFLALISWVSIGLLFLYTPPTLGPRWIFFFLFYIAILGTFLPILILINRRINKRDGGNINAALRQSLMLGFYFDLMIWLHMGRVLDLITAFFILSIIIAIAVLIQVFEGSQWHPNKQQENMDEIRNSPFDEEK